ncbi:o-succinylbenzoate synthase [Frigoriflavimonas asaccharolytica]|uniref:O-succinylbenzoate synthase n=1 Tax=Frigoriflavimonas asaccharolytica TaxID=2735899 RepID=A0A8J8GBW3_9FLAO|nr:o-succinylbenzoate synthase [Frigoriflavimonas asaccharolytica]NRS93115.1 o-succinylbenzoate synthase [Frigoriflavimonas asaccharolytica]
MKTAKFSKYILNFKNPSGTSRGILKTKETFFLEIFEENKKGVGECALFRGLSFDDVPEYEEKLQWLCNNINENPEKLKNELLNFPSIWFGYEQAFLNLNLPENIYFPSEFNKGKSSIKINGLIWMGDPDFMQTQIEEKLAQGFDCIKLKIGVDWNSEYEILKNLRQKFPANILELRVDANGGFTFDEAKIVLQELADLKIHSIEQPIKAMHPKSQNDKDCFVARNDDRSHMAELCAETPTPIALDEELIGVVNFEEKKALLEKIKPQFIILKPALVGGFSGCDEWIFIAEKMKIKWWITSALESNIGLNAIAQYTFTKNNTMPQGLGTGGLFTNNLNSALDLQGDQLSFKTS